MNLGVNKNVLQQIAYQPDALQDFDGKLSKKNSRFSKETISLAKRGGRGRIC